MLNIDSEMIRDILDKARQFQAKEAVSFPEVTDEMDAMYVLADYPDDAVFQDATQVIDNLRPDQQATLIALMLLGQGDFTLEEWPQSLSTIRDALPEYPAKYLLSHPQMPDDIERALNLLGIN